jgi:hypothetical protein
VSSSAHGHSAWILICTLDKFHRQHDTREEESPVLPNPSNNLRCDFKVAMLIMRFQAGFSGFRKASYFNAAPLRSASSLRKQFVDDQSV